MMTDKENLFCTRKILIFMVGLVLACLCCLPSDGLAANRILNIRHWVAPDHTRVVIDTREAARYQVVKEGQVLSLYFLNSDVQQSIPASILLEKRGIEKIQHEPVSNHKHKIDFFLDQNVETKIFNLKKVEDKPYRIVIDIELPDIEKKEFEERTQAREQQRDRIIIIDPGHGGDDPGAVGKGGTYEKDVVLEIGRRLKTFLNQQPGYRAFMTREGDYYVAFKKRLQIAREYGAAMFISIHADAALNREARGSSVYCLSLNGASSAAARILANKENLADMVGGSPNGESSEESDPIILNMCQTNTINVSRNFGATLLNRLGEVGPVKFRDVQEAQLRVLKLPEIPSVLVETAYISNEEEEDCLKDPAFQSRMAETIGKAICMFEPSIPLKPSVSPAILVNNVRDTEMGRKTRYSAMTLIKKTSANKSKKENSLPVVFHKVKRGETLQKIALRYNMSLADLAQLNAIRIHAPLPAGKTLRVAKLSDPGLPESEKSLTPLHKVQRGETLDAIARRYHTSIAALLELNGMTLKDPLYAGVTIKVNGNATDDGSVDEGAGAHGIRGKVPNNKHIIRTALQVASYEVKKGDSLDSIARKHNTTIADLLKLNSMKKSDTLFAGNKIRLPETASGAAESKEGRKLSSTEGTDASKKKAGLITYKVKRGDTLDTIARKYKTRIDVLLSLNKMKLTDPLYADQPLKLPRDSSFF